MTSLKGVYEVTRKSIEKPSCGKRGCKGTLWRVDLSRLEEGLGHEGYKCDTCERRVKYVPTAEGK